MTFSLILLLISFTSKITKIRSPSVSPSYPKQVWDYRVIFYHAHVSDIYLRGGPPHDAIVYSPDIPPFEILSELRAPKDFQKWRGSRLT